MEPENHLLGKKHLPNLHFLVPLLIFRGVNHHLGEYVPGMSMVLSKFIVTPIYVGCKSPK